MPFVLLHKDRNSSFSLRSYKSIFLASRWKKYLSSYQHLYSLFLRPSPPPVTYENCCTEAELSHHGFRKWAENKCSVCTTGAKSSHMCSLDMYCKSPTESWMNNTHTEKNLENVSHFLVFTRCLPRKYILSASFGSGLARLFKLGQISDSALRYSPASFPCSHKALLTARCCCKAMNSENQKHFAPVPFNCENEKKSSFCLLRWIEVLKKPKPSFE